MSKHDTSTALIRGALLIIVNREEKAVMTYRDSQRLAKENAESIKQQNLASRAKTDFYRDKPRSDHSKKHPVHQPESRHVRRVGR